MSSKRSPEEQAKIDRFLSERGATKGEAFSPSPDAQFAHFVFVNSIYDQSNDTIRLWQAIRRLSINGVSREEIMRETGATEKDVSRALRQRITKRSPMYPEKQALSRDTIFDGQ